MKRNVIKSLALTLALTLGASAIGALADTVEVNPISNGTNQTGDILVLGGDLNDAERTALLTWFQAPEGTKTIYTTNEIIIEQLGLDANDPANYQGGCYSSAYVKITEPSMGKGKESSSSNLNIEVENLTEVTDIMLMNALITSGITTANVKVSAPFPVTGTSALAGILAGAENVRGEEISLKQKKTAQEEIETTMEVSEEIGAEEASSIINEIKTEVIKESPKNGKEIEKIVNNIINNYEINISDNSKQQIVQLMSDVNDLDLDYDAIKDSLAEAGDKIKDKLTDLNKQLKESGFWDKVKTFFRNLWDKMSDFLSNLTENNLEEETPVNEEDKETPVMEEKPVMEERPVEEEKEETPVEEKKEEVPVEEEKDATVEEETPAEENVDDNVIMPDEEKPVETSSVTVYDYDNTPDREYMGLRAPAVANSKLQFNS